METIWDSAAGGQRQSAALAALVTFTPRGPLQLVDHCPPMSSHLSRLHTATHLHRMLFPQPHLVNQPLTALQARPPLSFHTAFRASDSSGTDEALAQAQLFSCIGLHQLTATVGLYPPLPAHNATQRTQICLRRLRTAHVAMRAGQTGPTKQRTQISCQDFYTAGRRSPIGLTNNCPDGSSRLLTGRLVGLLSSQS